MCLLERDDMWVERDWCKHGHGYTSMCLCVHTWVQWGWADTTHTTGDRHPQAVQTQIQFPTHWLWRHPSLFYSREQFCELTDIKRAVECAVLKMQWKKWSHSTICKTLNIMAEFNLKFKRCTKSKGYPSKHHPKEQENLKYIVWRVTVT